MSGIMEQHTQTETKPRSSDVEIVRCVECAQIWPRTAMRWGARPSGPVWFPRTVRVLRCPDCLPD